MLNKTSVISKSHPATWCFRLCEKKLQNFFVAVFSVFLLTGADSVKSEDLRLFVVTKTENTLPVLSKSELRSLFLGTPVYRNNKKLEPLINKSDERCYQTFLQSVLGMSNTRYERVQASMLDQKGAVVVPVYTDLDKLMFDLKRKNSAISFVFLEKELADNSLNVVQEIWISGAQ
ncbi:hypothetical protein MNBD_GAMMA06-948 [hydrothermal vent metagenome]|uniref:Uncharacterized protein n=1 Tax=hydrothermal vent metagenome TaxID=652676 RepID=A0A3B0X613_9ZZZZ